MGREYRQGCVRSAPGGRLTFMHIQAFPQGSARPLRGMHLTYRVIVTAAGKRQATRVRNISSAKAKAKARTNVEHRRRRGGRRRYTLLSFLAVLAFAALYLSLNALHPVPVFVAATYAAMSAVCFLCYGIDKAAAVAGRWRVPESTLLVLGFACGWPGAIVAQQLFTHKTTKRSFRSAFWISVTANVVIAVGLFYVLTTGF